MSLKKERIYIAIDLKSFFASVECVERGLDPLTTNLVVADGARTEKTICLAVTPALKSFGISGRARLYEVVQQVGKVNRTRKLAIRKDFEGSSCDINELKENPNLSLNYIIAPPRMSYYMDYSTRVYSIYLRYIAPEDIHVYSIDEVFMDVTDYLNTYKCTPRELAMKMIHEVLKETGITATAGIGTNLYLCKIAMDIVAKHIPADKDGVRIAYLDEMTYRKELWNHRPLTDFWRIGKGTVKRLADKGLYTMGDIARCSIGKKEDYYNEELLYKLFGINAELIIDHAWGYEPTRISDIKSYKSETNSLGNSQVLSRPYQFDEGLIVIKEMAESLTLSLVEKKLVCSSVFVGISYDIENVEKDDFEGETSKDFYGRIAPKSTHGIYNFESPTNSNMLIRDAAADIYQRTTNPNFTIRKLSITANNVIYEKDVPNKEIVEQMDMFTDYQQKDKQKEQFKQELEKEKKVQQAILQIKNTYGKNAVIKAVDLDESATAKERNEQIGGHKA